MCHSPIVKTTGLSYCYSSEVKTLSGIYLYVERGDIHNDLDVYFLQPRERTLEQLFIDLTTVTS